LPEIIFLLRGYLFHSLTLKRKRTHERRRNHPTGTQRQPDAAIKVLYREFPKVCGLIIASGGDEAEARATFHDALILVMEKVQDPTFVLTCKLTTYLFGVNRLLWKNKLRKLNSIREVEWSDTLILTNDDLGIDEEQESLIAAMEHGTDAHQRPLPRNVATLLFQD
jgi:DNA-directed RNA polymerase specialized sigma24 family protein